VWKKNTQEKNMSIDILQTRAKVLWVYPNYLNEGVLFLFYEENMYVPIFRDEHIT